MPLSDYYHANNIAYTNDLNVYADPDGVMREHVHCSIHGIQTYLIGEGCAACVDDFMKKVDEAWPRGCPKGYGE